MDDATLSKWRGLSYAELAFEVLSLYIDDIPAADLKDITARTYNKAVYGFDEITPLKPLEPGWRCKPCPTAPRWPSRTWPCRLLGNLFEYENWAAVVSSSTSWAPPSGDTGSAAEYAMRGKKGVRASCCRPMAA